MNRYQIIVEKRKEEKERESFIENLYLIETIT